MLEPFRSNKPVEILPSMEKYLLLRLDNMDSTFMNSEILRADVQLLVRTIILLYEGFLFGNICKCGTNALLIVFRDVNMAHRLMRSATLGTWETLLPIIQVLLK